MVCPNFSAYFNNFLKEIKNQETAQLSQIISNLLLLAILIKEFVE